MVSSSLVNGFSLTMGNGALPELSKFEFPKQAMHCTRMHRGGVPHDGYRSPSPSGGDRSGDGDLR